MKYRSYGSTGIKVSELGYGTVKIGRNTKVKYPKQYDLPNKEQVTNILNNLQKLGINLLDTSPAYGTAEEMLGKTIKNRKDWIISTKVGEIFDGENSTYCFDTDFIRKSVEQSLTKLKTDYVDILMLHLDYPTEIETLQNDKVTRTIDDLKSEGLIKATGASIYTVKGGIIALNQFDGAMVSYSPLHLGEEEVIKQAEKTNKGILVKKGLECGNFSELGDTPIQACFKHIMKEKGVSSAVIASLNIDNIKTNAKIIDIAI